jgi:hypothetical protein
MEKVNTEEDLESGSRVAEANKIDHLFKDDAVVVDDINKLIKSNNVVVFSLSTCPFCIELKRSLGFQLLN